LPAPERRRLRLLLGAFGDPGHAFPLIALGGALVARGHAVTLQTWSRWQEEVRAAGMRFEAAPEYHVFPTRERPLKPYEAVVRATVETRPLVASLRPDVVVADILTLAPALAAELEGVPVATVIPHVDPRSEPGWPPYSLGARLPRTAVGRRLWGFAARATDAGLEHGRRELNETRRRLGLGPLDRVHGGISRALALVATFPQLEYPRRWPAGIEITGPMTFEVPHPDIELPPGDAPLVLVAPSTAHDSNNHLVRTALKGLADEPVRVVATTNRVVPQRPIDVPPNTTLVDWLSYSQLMPAASLVISHGGHGTVARALGAGTPVLICPFTGDMSETAMRVDWAKVGLSLPWRLCEPRPLRWAAHRLLGDASFTEHAERLAAWSRENDGGERGAELIEQLARTKATAR
jgi:UDP:flavonoid glycosyltransferase YjiC (YdhE family)